MSTPRVELHWIPLGAGAHVVRWSGSVYERWHAGRAHRAPRQIYHSALVVRSGHGDTVIEQAPASRHGERRGVVAEGPVGSRAMVRWPLPRYEVRCWTGGRIDDLEAAVGAPTVVTTDETTCRGVISSAAAVPSLTWGRDATGTGEMWNSNSVVAWILQHSGLDPARFVPPRGGIAPGWGAGCVQERC